jgi:para-nitrobenzyl esterase
MRLFPTLAIIALAAMPVVATAQAPAPAPAPAAAAPAYSTGKSTIGALMGNPATKDIVVKAIPEMAQAVDNPQAAGMTLKDVQQYLPTVTDKLLTDMDVELAKVPAPK